MMLKLITTPIIIITVLDEGMLNIYLMGAKNAQTVDEAIDHDLAID